MAKLAVIACVLLGVLAVSAAPLLKEEEYKFLFSKWMQQHNKKYTHDTFFYRYTVWKNAMDLIITHNDKNSSWSMAMNDMGDMTAEEFKSAKLGYNRVKRDYQRSQLAAKPTSNIVKAAASVDWRTAGAVTPIKNQQQCGSCWAFSAVGAIEGAVAIKTKVLQSLAEQELVDCSRSYGNAGCAGGLMDYAFEYVRDKKGLCKESDYTYVAKDQTCQLKSNVCPKNNGAHVSPITSYADVASMHETTDLITAVNKGPVSIAIEADTSEFQYYSKGVFDYASCGTNLDHGVLVVGYGNDSKIGSGDYWIVKNSWGTSWGASGYIYMIRGKNMCGLAIEPSYPIA